MIKIDTIITIPDKNFDYKKDWKEYCITNFVPENIDPLRIYNFSLMKKYGDGFFYLIFKKPNKGILNHIYQTFEEYEKSIPLRKEQKKLFNENNISYEISEPYEIHDKILTKIQYNNLHPFSLIPLDIKSISICSY